MKNALILLLLFTSLLSQSFISHIQLKAEIDQTGETNLLVVNFTIDEGWHIYGLEKLKSGPIPTSINLKSGQTLKLIEKPESKNHFDEGFEINVEWFSNTGRFVFESDEKIDLVDEVLFRFQICTEINCLPPRTIAVPITKTNESIVINESLRYKEPSKLDNSNIVEYSSMKDMSFWAFIGFAITVGFISLLTPCVFPMIPITVSFFTKNGEETKSKAIKLGLVYGLGIVSIFTLFGFTISMVFGAAGVQNLAANPWLNLTIGILFVVFALSLFGLFEMQLPSSWVNKVNALGVKPGYLGVLLAGVAFALVTFTCTAPFVGTLLSQASQGDWLYPFFGMLLFSAAFASPFILLAIFPQFIAQMPKSGGWLHSTKIVMAFFEIAAAFKFFSQSDLVWDLEILTRPFMIAIWFVLFLLSGLYLLGSFKLSKEDTVEKIGVVRLFISIIFLIFSVYLVSGINGRSLQADLDAYLPPTDYGQEALIYSNQKNNSPHLSWIEDYKEGLNSANKSQTLIFVDFTGKTCTNCRWMEKKMFVLPDVHEKLGGMTRVRLWTDFGENKEFNQELQLKLFNSVALPYYAILDENGNVLRSFSGMTRDKQEFINFLTF